MRLSVAVVVLAAACGSKSPSTTTTPASVEPPPVVLPDVPFDDLDQDQRAEFMKQKVLPVMKAMFQKHNPSYFRDFGCHTCHGPQVKDGHYDMPNPNLPKLNLADTSRFKPADIEWMKNEVWPTMGKILREELYSEQKPDGFSCFNCHTEDALAK